MVITESLILNLKDITEKDINKIGSKAANLGTLTLIRKNFSVPEGFVITVAAYSLFLKANDLEKLIQKLIQNIDYSNYETIETCSRKIKEEIEQASLPPKLVEEIKKKFEDLGINNLVVRSSGLSEDLPTASFAGLYESFLNLKSFDDILQYIKRCYSSVWTSRAIVYRNENQIPHDNAELAVIIQKMIPAKSAGVLFTADPISLESSNLLIESNFGLGESVMSGVSSPDQYTVHRGGSFKKKLFKILKKRIGLKNVAAHPKSSENENGIEYIKLSDEMNRKSSLSDEQIIQLAQIGSEVEHQFGSPQDIEWAIDQYDQIHLLQTRPITSMKSAQPIEKIIWTRGYADDYWNDSVTPLFFDLLGDQLTLTVNMELNSIMGYQRMEKKLMKPFKAHVYFNLEVMKRKVEYEIPGFIRNEDLLNYFPEGSGPFGQKTMKNLPFRTFKWIVAQLRVMLYDSDGSITKTDSKYETWTQEEFFPYCDEFDSRLKNLVGTGSIKALIDLTEELDQKMVAHFRLVRYGIPVHNIGMNLMAQALLTRFLGKKEMQRLYPILISNLKHKLTETNERIHDLAIFIRGIPELREAILEKDSKELYSYLSSEKNPAIKSFFEEFEKFLKDHGDRGFTREPYYPRWRDGPEYIFDILKSLIAGEVQEMEKENLKITILQENIDGIVQQKIRSTRLGFLKWKIFSIILKFARRYIIFRENQRFNLDRWITRNRHIFLEIGEQFTRQGKLQKPIEIFFLHKKEIKKLVFQDLSDNEVSKISTVVKKRYEEFLKYENIIPPKFIEGSQEFNDPTQFTKESTSFRGIPASQGINTAPIRVLTRIEDIPSVKAGEILVVPRTDPGWTPIFSKIAGLITETGGILSHGAVISREYGVPAVTNIPNACKLFQTGQVVSINGNNGWITLQK
ncbi:hypothetical protein ES706_06115 [subsurface metagenome]